MKRLFAVCMLMFVFVVSGCGNINEVKNRKKLKDDIPEITGKIEYMDSFSTTYSDDTIKFEILDDDLLVNASFTSGEYRRLMVVFNGDTEKSVPIDSANGVFEARVSLPDEDTITADLYGGAEQYGTFQSIIMDVVKIEKDGKDYRILGSPVYESNKTIFELDKTPEDYLEATESIQSDDEEILSLAQEITSGISDDYRKVRAIHDWVCENIYYDMDALRSGDFDDMDALAVLDSKRSVCEGYANVMAALIRSIDIPCIVQGGYALGIDTNREWTEDNINTMERNHAWNEVYVDGRWIIIDATWDSENEYIDGTYKTGNVIKDIYFDSTLEFFSFSHKLM